MLGGRQLALELGKIVDGLTCRTVDRRQRMERLGAALRDNVISESNDIGFD
jgi:hypothetical protein